MRILSYFILSAVLCLGLILRQRAPRFELEPFPGPLRLVLGVLWLIAGVALVCFVPLEGLIDPEDSGAPIRDVRFVTLFAGHALLAVFLLGWWALAGFERPGRFLRLPGGSLPRRLAIGVVVGLVGWAATIGAMAAVGSIVGIEEAVTGAATSDSGEGLPQVMQMLVEMPILNRVLLVVSAGVFEEAFFRSFLQTRGGLVLSTILFAMGHASYGSPFMLVGVFAVSVVLGLVFRSTGDVLPCMVAHSVFDAVQLLVVMPAIAAAAAGA